MKITTVNVWMRSDGTLEKFMVAYDDRTMVSLDLKKEIPKVVFDFMRESKEHDAITLSNGRTLNSFYN